MGKIPKGSLLYLGQQVVNTVALSISTLLTFILFFRKMWICTCDRVVEFRKLWGVGYSSMVEFLQNIQSALGLISSKFKKYHFSPLS